MDELFSCRNCIQNAGQSLTTGRGSGFCLTHNSVIPDPIRTTCKFLHRKDLPSFAVEEGVRDHASEFATVPGMADLHDKTPVRRVLYSEKYAWDHDSFDPVIHALAQYHKADKSWIFIQGFASGIDGRRSIAYASLVRRYVDTCETWTSSYRLFLGFLQEIDIKPDFEARSLVPLFPHDSIEDTREHAFWDVVFGRISALQEYGWHAGLEDLMWATDSLNGALSECNWKELEGQLTGKKEEWTRQIVDHAKREDVYFPSYGDE